MDLTEIADRTTVYWNCKIRTLPSAWYVGNAECVEAPFEFATALRESLHLSEDQEGDNILCIRMLPPYREMTAAELPTEFFNHQLLAVDVSNRESVVDFISHWGIPFSPFRSEEGMIGDWGIFEEESVVGINETEEVIKLLSRFTRDKIEEATLNYAEAYQGGNTVEQLVELAQTHSTLQDAVHADTAGYVVSLREAAATLNLLKNMVFLLDRCISSETWKKADVDRIIGVLSAASSSRRMPTFVQDNSDDLSAYGLTLRARGMLTAAICNQLCDALADREPWRLCASETCSVIFKRQQALSRRKKGSYTKPYAGSIYCSTRCSEAQRKRNRRKKKDQI